MKELEQRISLLESEKEQLLREIINKNTQIRELQKQNKEQRRNFPIAETPDSQNLDQLTTQILDEQENIKDLLTKKDGEIWQLKTALNSFKNQLKMLLGINLSQDLPTNWVHQIVKKAELTSFQSQLSKWENQFPNSTPQSITYKLDQLKEKNSQLERKIKQIEPETTVIYFCDICQTSKNSKIDGEVYQIKVRLFPDKISNVCPTCRPNVTVINDHNWKDY
jgi:hypothetical protein